MPTSDNNNKMEDPAELKRLNAQLADSLERCRRILADCRAQLAVNADEPEAGGDSTHSVLD